MVWKRYIIPTVIVAAFIWVIYRQMGGGGELTFTLVDSEETILNGYDFRGRPTHPDLEKYFYSMRDLSSFRSGEQLTVISFGTEESVDTLHQFIGTQANYNGGDTLETFMIPEGKFVQVRLDMASMVRPSPGRVREEAEDFAASRNLTLGKWNAEIFVEEEVLLIKFPVEN